MEPSKSAQTGFLNRVRHHRLTSTFALLATLSTGVIVGSVITHGVSGQEKGNSSADAARITIPNPVQLSNGFSQIVKQVEPAVVNINVETLPKQSANQQRRRRPGTGNGDDQQNDMQDFLQPFLWRPGRRWRR